MAQISKNDLDHLTSEEIKSFYKAEDIQTQLNISPMYHMTMLLSTEKIGKK